MLGLSLILLLGVATPRPASSGGAPAADTIPLTEWLVLGPTGTQLPAFHTDSARPFTLGDLLEFDGVDLGKPWPAGGDSIAWPDGRWLRWTARQAEGGAVPLGLAVPGRPSVGYVATYLRARRFVKGTLTIETNAPARIYLSGDVVATKRSDEPGTLTVPLALPTGKHAVIIRVVARPAQPDTWRLDARLIVDSGFVASDLEVSTDPMRYLTIGDLLDAEAVSSVAFSADGALVAAELRQPEVPADDQERWVEILRRADGAVVRSFRGDSPVAQFAWGPSGQTFSYVTRHEGKATLWVSDMAGGAARAVLRGVERLGGYAWAPDGRSIVYAVSEEAQGDETTRGVKRMRGLFDRWRGWRDKSHLYQVAVPGGTRRRLTAGSEAADIQDIRPDGARLLFTRTHSAGERPFTETELFELDLETLDARSLGTFTFGASAQYGREGRRILVQASPSAFGGAGLDVPQETIPNDYDTQLYVLDPATGEADPITRSWAPSVQQAVWSRHDGRIYVQAIDGPFVRLFRYDVDRRSFTRLSTGVDVVESFSIARGAPQLVFQESSANAPPSLRALSLERPGEPRVLLTPGAAVHRQVRLGRVEDFDFQTPDGATIRGRIHYPPDFDPARRYPAIVYYYGGTVPVTRSFGGRYPLELWSGRGYVVYVPQPSGAIGFGQAFSARHVNNWGRTVADEIILGTEQFLAAHPFVDPDRVGCIGASYGGFMTMLLTTRTDAFAACVAHAGISSLSSYWGEGWWGHLYSAVASAESYPWNARDLYVEQSPLFHADRIQTPLLLLHGTDDTNVPIGESEQLYTALELLGKEVEFVKVEGEDHHVLQYPKRELWMETILAWFDRYLGAEPAYWRHLYGSAR